MRVGVFGGTFDPPHIGHLLLAEQAREQLDLGKVLWVPAGDPWRKSGGAVSPAADRLAMVRLAIEGNDAFEVSELELERAGPTYSVETLEELRRTRPRDELFFLLGLDALLDLPNWHEPARLIELATLAAARRGERAPSLADLDALLPGLAERVVWLEMPRIDLSGTELRRRAAEGRSLRYAVPDAVERYAREKRLYAG